MATSLPVYQPYSTVQNSYQQLMGGNPIQYNVPLSSLRRSSNSPNITKDADLTNQDIVNQRAQKLANEARAQQQAGYTAYGDTINYNMGLLGQLDVSRDAAANLYAGAYNSGMVKNSGPSYNAQGNQGVPGSTLYKTNQANRDLNYANTQARFLLGGVNPQEVERAYQRLLNNNQF